MEQGSDRGDEDRELVRDALRLLGVQSLVLAIHDPSFPSDADEDTGRGSPYTAGGRRFLRFARDLGFTGVQLGPQGETSADNPSPYDGTIFSRSTLSIALAPLAQDGPWGPLLRPATLGEIVANLPGGHGRADHRYAFRAQRRALDEAFAAFRGGRERGEHSDLVARHAAFRKRAASWIERDALYGPLCVEHRSGWFHGWSGEPDIDRRLFAPGPGEAVACAERRVELLAKYHDEVERYAFCQLLAHEQHAGLRALTAELGLKLYGDLQIGYSPQDAWAYQSLFLRGYLMGAPPSRTNPEGQPWNYPVLDPEQYAAGGALGALSLVQARMGKMFDEFDGVRIDHPHGLVCPWVYEAFSPDPLRAVQGGARLFSSPDLPDHPGLARYAIVTPAQLDRRVPRYADGWVSSLAPEQVRRYSVLFDAIAECARARGRDTTDIVCEVLSTLPNPLKAVLERHGLGRFRVTQKADLDNPADVYRSENAAPGDWIMVGTHDTPPIWRLLDTWEKTRVLEKQANYLAARLAPSPAEEGSMARALAADPRLLAQAKFADLFASRATHVMVFFADLLGLKEVYNAPGTVNDDNWSLRVPEGYARAYAESRARGAALDLPRALAMALRAGRGEESEARRGLIQRLERRERAG